MPQKGMKVEGDGSEWLVIVNTTLPSHPAWVSSNPMLLDVHKDHGTVSDGGAKDSHLFLHTAPEFCNRHVVNLAVFSRGTLTNKQTEQCWLSLEFCVVEGERTRTGLKINQKHTHTNTHTRTHARIHTHANTRPLPPPPETPKATRKTNCPKYGGCDHVRWQASQEDRLAEICSGEVTFDQLR